MLFGNLNWIQSKQFVHRDWQKAAIYWTRGTLDAWSARLRFENWEVPRGVCVPISRVGEDGRTCLTKSKLFVKQWVFGQEPTWKTFQLRAYSMTFMMSNGKIRLKIPTTLNNLQKQSQKHQNIKFEGKISLLSFKTRTRAISSLSFSINRLCRKVNVYLKGSLEKAKSLNLSVLVRGGMVWPRRTAITPCNSPSLALWRAKKCQRIWGKPRPPHSLKEFWWW